MHVYKREIKAGPILEVEYYQSIRQRNKKHIGRSRRKGLTPEKQKTANQIRGIKATQRLILNNFKPGGLWVKFGFRNPVTEDDAKRLINNFLKRLKRHHKRNKSELKYIGAAECGAREHNWHLHLVLEKIDLDTLQKLWSYGGVWVTPLYKDGNYKKLAEYIRKQVGGKKRLMQSRNLIKPREKVTEISKREINKLSRGEIVRIPKGYYLVEDDFIYNEYTDTKYYFVFQRLEN